MNPEAERDGRNAWKAGTRYGDNPHKLNDAFHAHMSWARGWRAAAAEDHQRRVQAFSSTYEANARRRGQYDA